MHLLYMGNYVFAELKRKLYSAPNPQSIITDPMLQIQAMKKSVYMEVPTPLNLLNITNKASTATVTSEQVSMLSTSDEQIPIMSGTNEQHVTSDTTSDNIDVSQMVFEGTTSVDMNPVPVYGQPVFPAAKQILLLHLHLSEEEDDSSEDSLPTWTESEALSSDHEDIIPSESVTGKVMKAPPEILNKECQIKLDQLTDDEISM